MSSKIKIKQIDVKISAGIGKLKDDTKNTSQAKFLTEMSDAVC